MRKQIRLLFLSLAPEQLADMLFATV